MSMENKTAVIFGGSGPLGRMTAKMFMDAGARVHIGWNSQGVWDSAREFLSGYEASYSSARVDVTDETSVQEFMAGAAEALGRIDVMLYMGGAFSIGPRLWETDTAVFANMLRVNLTGAFLAAKYPVPLMLARDSGHIFFFPAKSVVEARPHFAAYGVTKSGLLSLMDGLCAELKGTGVTVNCVMPDAVDTPKTRMAPHAEPDKWVKPQEVAELLISVCSCEGNIVNGAVLKVFGKA